MRLASVLRLELTENWMFREASDDTFRPAEVPGCIHTDLMRNKLIPDPFFGVNEQKLQWIGEKDWVYQTTFDLPAGMLKRENVELVFRGLDTYASVTLNRSPILTADNMFREWRIACKGLLQEKGNVLAVRFRNVFDENLPQYKSAPYPLQAFGTNDQADVKISMYSRKAQFHYGWDWGPRLITCGIWRPALLEAWIGVRIKSVFVRQENVTAAGADIVSVLELLSDEEQPARISAAMDAIELNSEQHGLKKGFNRITVKGHLDKPALWWTNGLGRRHLYHYRGKVETAGKAADEYTTRIGVRSLEIVRDKDASGTSLYVRLNGVPVFMKGANYVPQDNFQNRVTRERYDHIIGSAAAAHMNMLRVWGGGIFEDDAFYETCDRYGILIWQDMQFACAMYPADAAFLENVRQEVIDNVTRIRNHASLALYCANNENEACWHQFGWKKLYAAETQAAHERDVQALYYETIAPALKEADPTRYYHSSSPSAGYNNVPYGQGDIHYWGVWHGKEPFETYPDNIARFVSEYGFQSYPELSTVRKFTEPKDRELHSEVMRAHQRCMADERKDKEYGNRLIQMYMDRWYRTPKDFESYLYVSQVMQAEGVRVGMEAHRRAMPYCMGSLYWQIDDCWPVASWSSIDYFGRWKALHYAARRCFAPAIVSVVVKENEAQFHIVYDRLKPMKATLEIRVLDFSGREISRRTLPVAVAANTVKSCLALTRRQLTGSKDEAQLVIVSRLIDGNGVVAENLSYFRLPKDLELSPPELASRIRKSAGGYSIEVSSRSLARSVMLACGDEAGFFSDNYFDLLPGGKKIVGYATSLSEKRLRQQLKAISLIDSYY
jgi:beta-mannosidase